MKHFCVRWLVSKPLAALLLLPALLFAASGTSVAEEHLTRSRLKNGTQVRSAFRDVVAGARRSTVAVLSGGKQVALGAVVDADGYIMTKASELDGEIQCKIGNQTVTAEIVGVSTEDDLALLKANATDLTPVTWRSGSKPRPGQWVATAGPGAIPLSVGVLSVKRRRIPAPRPLLGVSIEDAEDGARILEVAEGSGAERAGLQKGDVITWIAGAVVKNKLVLSSQIRKFRPGDTLMLKVRRDNTVMKLKATLGSSINPKSRRAIQNKMGGKLSIRRHGFPAAFQHDGYLKPEQCGGPVVDLQGRVIGINIARAGRTESYAVPVERIRTLLPKLKSGELAPEKTESTSTPTDAGQEGSAADKRG